jgi:hypothetical protein
MDGSKSDLAEGDLLHRVDDSDYMHGVPMIEAMASADEAALRSLLLEWKQLLERSPAPSLELVPANLIVSPSGEIEAIDQEWSIEGSTTAHVLERGAVWTAHHLARLTNPARWTSVGETVRDVAIHLSSMIDLDPAGGWIEAAITREAELQAVVHDCEREAPGFPAHAQSRREQLSELISARIEDGPLGAQRGIASRLAVAEALVIEQEGHIGRLREMASEKDRHIQNLQAMAEEKDGHIAHLQATAEEKDAALAQSHKELERVREFSLARLTDAAARLRKKSSNK